MLKNRNSLSKAFLFLAVFLLHLSIHFSPVPIRLSASLVSATGPPSQDYIIHEPIEITNDNELAAIANSGSGTANDPYIIADWNITGSTTHGIFITGTTKHFRVENCWIESLTGYVSAIYVVNVASETTTIINNTCNSIGNTGIKLTQAGSSTVANNTCNSNNWAGIGLWHSGSSTVTNNTCNNNIDYGIHLSRSGSSIVTKNTCNNNGDDGISLKESGFSTVTNNTCNNNDDCGFGLWDSDNNSIVWNTLVENGAYGIELSHYSAKNVIHHNDFIGNGHYTSQASDDCTNNTWYDETVLEGNYWSDYSGTGSYVIAGWARASDPYPSLSPYGYTREIDSSSSPTFPQDVSVRIGFFLVVGGFLVLVLFVNRRKISS